MARCPKCEGMEFSIEEVESPLSMMFVVCVECDIIINSVENLNFDIWSDEIEENHNHFKKELNAIREEIVELRKDIHRKFNFIIELIEMR